MRGVVPVLFYIASWRAQEELCLGRAAGTGF